MIVDNLEIVFLVAWIIALSNILSSGIGLLMTPLLARATIVRHTIVAPVLIGLSLIGSFIESKQVFGMVLAVAAGIVGYFLKGLGFSNAGLILGFVLGPVVDIEPFNGRAADLGDRVPEPVTFRRDWIPSCAAGRWVGPYDATGCRGARVVGRSVDVGWVCAR